MKRLEITDREMMQIALRNEILRSEEARYDHRLHGVLLVSQGMSCYAVGEVFGQDPTTIQRWVRRFETRGFSGLQDQERPGRPQRLTPEQLERVNRALRTPPRALGYAQNLWDGTLLSHHLAQAEQVVLGVRQCQRLFHHLEFRLRKPRPVIARANPEEQQAFKKTPPAGKTRRRGSVESG